MRPPTTPRGTLSRAAAHARLAPLLLLAACQASPGGGACTVQWHSTLPVVMRQALAVVPARVNGEVVGLGVDSGAAGLVVTPELVARLDLRPDPGMSAQRATGLGGNAYSQVVAIDSLQFAGVTYRKLDAFAASIGQLGREDMAVSGLVGEDLLSRYDVGFDIAHREISFFTVRNCATVSPPWGDAAPIPIRLSEHNHLVFDVELDGRRLVAMLDSGAGEDLLLERGASTLRLSEARLEHDPAATSLGMGERTISSRTHRFATLKVGNETIQDPVMQVAEAGENDPDIDLILGMDFLRDRQVLVSHSTARMFVRSSAGASRLAEGHE